MGRTYHLIAKVLIPKFFTGTPNKKSSDKKDRDKDKEKKRSKPQNTGSNISNISSSSVSTDAQSLGSPAPPSSGSKNKAVSPSHGSGSGASQQRQAPQVVTPTAPPSNSTVGLLSETVGPIGHFVVSFRYSYLKFTNFWLLYKYSESAEWYFRIDILNFQQFV